MSYSTTAEVPRVKNLSCASFQRHVEAANRPILIEEPDWDVSTWSRQTLAEDLRGLELSIEHYPEGLPQVDRHVSTCELRTMSFDEYMALSEATERLYYLALTIEDYPQLRKRLSVPSLVPENRYSRSTLFVGHSSMSAGHYHQGREAFLCQVEGTKVMTLFPPTDLVHLDMRPWFSTKSFHGMSRLDFESAKARVQLGKTRPLQARVERGQLLFVPRDWLHVVEASGFSITQTTFWWEKQRLDFVDTRRIRSRLRRYTAHIGL